MQIILFSLFLLSVVSLIPNCAYEANSKCLSCYYGFELAAGRCDNCSTGFMKMNDVCINQGIYQQQTLQQQVTGSSSSATSTTLQQNQATSGLSTGGTSVLQSQILQSTQSLSSTQTANTNTASSSILTSFETSNSGVMYLLQLFGLASRIPANCATFTSDFKCVRCSVGWNLVNDSCVLQTTNTAGVTGSTSTNSTSSSTISGSSFSSFGGQPTSGTPSLLNLVISNDPNCQTANADGSCSRCYFQYFYSAETRRCALVNPQCATWDRFGSCLSCYQGYKVSGTGCVIDLQSSSVSQQSSSQQSSSSSQSSQSSLTSTIINQPSTPGVTLTLITSDPNCKTPGFNGVCSQCYYWYYVNQSTGKCVIVNSNCQTWNNLGHCLTCYSGYVISGTLCIIGSSAGGSSSGSSSANSGSSNSNNSGIQWISGGQSPPSSSNLVLTPSFDPNCRTSNSDGSCSVCYPSFYYDSISTRRCTSVNPLCRTWNNLGQCLTCYQGYNLFNGGCVIEAAFLPSLTVGSNDLPSTNQDPYCNTYKDQVCVKCAARTYLDPSSRRCLQIDANCKAWTDSGVCTVCYNGYYIFNQRECRLIYPEVSAIQLKSPLNTDSNCRASDSNGICTQCIWRFVLNPTTKFCMKVNDLCRTWSDTTALCTGCYGGYLLTNNGECRMSW